MQPTIQKAAYAVLGTGDFAIEKAKGLPQLARQLPEKTRTFAESRRQDAGRLVEEFTGRGERLYRGIADSGAVKRAADQTRQARTQVKGALTSIRKAFGTQTEAAKTAAKKTG